MRIVWLDDVITDLSALRCYIAQDSVRSANNVTKKIVATTTLLCEQPQIGRQGRIPHTRELVISDTPYIVPYRVKNQQVEILRVFHGAMEWPDAL